MDYLDLYDITPEEEAAADRRAAEEEVDAWLASWSDDFNSDEWAVVAEINSIMVLTASWCGHIS